MNGDLGCIGDLYWTESEHRRVGHGRIMILLEIDNGVGKFHCQGSRAVIREKLYHMSKLNYDLPQYHKGNPDYFKKYLTS